jgi:hypothetical protein
MIGFKNNPSQFVPRNHLQNMIGFPWFRCILRFLGNILEMLSGFLGDGTSTPQPRLLDQDLGAIMKAGEEFEWQRIAFILEVGCQNPLHAFASLAICYIFGYFWFHFLLVNVQWLIADFILCAMTSVRLFHKMCVL